MHVPFAGSGSASAFPAPSVGKAPAFSPALRRHLFGAPPASFRRPAGTFPAPFRAPSAGIFRAPLRHFFRRSAGTRPTPPASSAGFISGLAPRRLLLLRTCRHVFSGTAGTPPASFPAPFRTPLRHLFRRSAGTRPTPPASSAGFISGLAPRRLLLLRTCRHVFSGTAGTPQRPRAGAAARTSAPPPKGPGISFRRG